MSDFHSQSRSRPVADAPVEALLARAEDLARRWAIALILARPLGRIGEIPLEDIAREAPDLCAQAVRALASDAELERLIEPGASAAVSGSAQPGIASRLAVLAGAGDAAASARAAEALRAVLWDALLSELPDPHPRQVAELADRLAAVCSAVVVAVLVAGETASLEVLPGADREPRAGQRSSAGQPPTAGQQPHAEPPRARVQPDFRAQSEPSSPWESQPRIEIRDERGEGPSAWIGSIGRRLERHEEDGLPFAVLLVEVVDVERLAQAGAPDELAQLIGKVENALSAELRPADLLTTESQGRYWLVTPETDGVGVRMLAERLARAVRASASDHGAPLEVAIGIAVCPDDGQDAASLAAHADAGVYAARASGQSIAPADEPQ